jgi:hypothetical protein
MVKDLLISPMLGGNLLGDCAKNDKLTRVKCMDEDPDSSRKKTDFACKKSSDTDFPCGANADTDVDCGDAKTLLPCLPEDSTAPPCAATPKDKTEYRCRAGSPEGPKTSVPCQGGSDTGIDGMPNSPWDGCLKGSKTLKSCSENSNTSLDCYDKPKDPDRTKYACTKAPLTQGICPLDSKTAGYKDSSTNWLPCGKKSDSKFGCVEGSQTTWCKTGNKTVTGKPGDPGKTQKPECWTPLTGDFCNDVKTEMYCNEPTTKSSEECWKGWGGTCWSCTAFKGTKTGWEAVAAGYPQGQVLDCPPLSPLRLPGSDPAALDALEILRQDLRQALGLVEGRQLEIQAELNPKSVAEADAMEKTLLAALEQVMAAKVRLASIEPPAPSEESESGQKD